MFRKFEFAEILRCYSRPWWTLHTFLDLQTRQAAVPLGLVDIISQGLDTRWSSSKRMSTKIEDKGQRQERRWSHLWLPLAQFHFETQSRHCAAVFASPFAGCEQFRLAVQSTRDAKMSSFFHYHAVLAFTTGHGGREYIPFEQQISPLKMAIACKK